TGEGSGEVRREPAWLQDLEGTTERQGRAQDKENLMARLRDLGYM
ncbi:nodulation protein, partial [Halomarina oriensis]|nr:nodulation protein [Halomarina oriensis]